MERTRWNGEAGTASAGSVSRVSAADIEDVIIKSLKEHLAANQGKSATATLPLGDRGALAQLVAGIVVHKDTLIVRLKSDGADEASSSAARAWSAQLHEVAGGWMMLSQVV